MSDDLEQRFEAAAVAARQLPERPDEDTLLQLYALYKQGSVGDVQGERPGLFDFVGQAKYSAWERLRDMPRAEAQRQYVDLVASLGGGTG